MATAEDIVRELTEQTKNGQITWDRGPMQPETKESEWWSSRTDKCIFTLFRNLGPRLDVHVGDAYSVVEAGPSVNELNQTVLSMFGITKATKDEILSDALACLQDHRSK